MSISREPFWTADELDSVNAIFDSAPRARATIGYPSPSLRVDTRIRDAMKIDIPRGDGPLAFIRDRLIEFGLEANAEWKADLNTEADALLLEYGVGGHVDWHQDDFLLNKAPSPRKITVLSWFSPPESYDGGEFEFDTHAVPKAGNIAIAFPSFRRHRVKPVTRGMRRVALVWMHGPRWR